MLHAARGPGLDRCFYRLVVVSNVAPTLVSLSIDAGAATTTSRNVALSNVCSGDPLHYMASEYADFRDGVWLPHVGVPTFVLSAGAGEKTVYLKIKNETGYSGAASDTIQFDELRAPISW
jgi:hypothetical protein